MEMRPQPIGTGSLIDEVNDGIYRQRSGYFEELEGFFVVHDMHCVEFGWYRFLLQATKRETGLACGGERTSFFTQL